MPNRERILLVEDDRDTLAGLFTLLTQAGYSVLTAENGAQAVDLLSHGIHPRLIVLDLMLPRVSGQEVLKHLREDLSLRHIPVIVVTALNPQEARTFGADVVLQKPIDPMDLITAIDKVLDGTTTR